MKFLSFILSLILGIPMGTVNAGPIIVRNGGGVGEFYLFYSLRNFPALIDNCLAMPTCSVGVENELSQLKIFKPYQKTELKFVTTSELGGDLYRATGDGSIVVNKDLLYVQRGGVRSPWIYQDAVTFLIRLWGEQLAWSSSIVSRLASHLSGLAEAKAERSIESELDLRQFSVVLIDAPFTSVVIEDDARTDGAQSIEIDFPHLLNCEAATGAKVPFSSLKIGNASWGSVNRHFPNGQIDLQILGHLSYECASSTNSVESKVGSKFFTAGYRVVIRARKSDFGWQLDPGSIRLEQVDIAEP